MKSQHSFLKVSPPSMNSIEYLLKSEVDMKLELNEKELEAISYFSFVLIRQSHSLFCAY